MFDRVIQKIKGGRFWNIVCIPMQCVYVKYVNMFCDNKLTRNKRHGDEIGVRCGPAQLAVSAWSALGRRLVAGDVCFDAAVPAAAAAAAAVETATAAAAAACVAAPSLLIDRRARRPV